MPFFDLLLIFGLVIWLVVGLGGIIWAFANNEQFFEAEIFGVVLFFTFLPVTAPLVGLVLLWGWSEQRARSGNEHN